MRELIVKVQRALNNDNILAYNKNKSIMWEGKAPSIYRLLEETGTNKAYFIARINKKKEIELKMRIYNQNF